MGFKEGAFPPVDPATFLQEPLRERIRKLVVHWGEYGFGTARMVHTTYIVKILVLYVLLGTIVATATSGVGWFWQVGQWWNEPIVYQKLIVWTVFLESLNIAGSWGPLAGKFRPMMGGALFWLRTGTIRLAPWKWVPGTAGTSRTGLDVLLYVAFLLSLLTTLLLPGVPSASLSEVLPDNTSGLVNTVPVVVAIVLWILIGLRDKVVFLAARAEQYLAAFVFFSVLPFTDMIIALKILIVASWTCAAISKFGHHFTLVVPAMVSNTPFWPPRWLKRSMYRDFPNDMRPSRFASVFSHGPGTIVELVTPLVLLFSTDRTVTLVAVILMVCFCLFILSTFPLAVPLEWNVLFAFAAVVLFLGFPAADGFAVTDFSNPWVLAAIVAGLLFFPVLGNFRPDLVSFLAAFRQYSGNWATGLWAFSPGAEAKLKALKRPTGDQIDQLQAMGYPYEAAEITMQQTIAFRSMQSQGKGTFSVLYKNLPDIEERTIREGEFATNAVIGFNFGDGHMQGIPLMAALQERCRFAPGEFVMAYAESSPLFGTTQEYMLIDAALGVLEKGTWNVKRMVQEQPWLPNGPIPLTVTWRADVWPSFDGTGGTVRRSEAASALDAEAVATRAGRVQA